MKKASFPLIGLILGILTGLAFLSFWGAARNGEGIGLESMLLLSMFIIDVSVLVALINLRARKQIDTSIPVVFAVNSIGAFVVLLGLVVYQPFIKEFRLTLDDNPFLYGGEAVRKTVRVSMFDRYFWMPRPTAINQLSGVYNKREKDSRLIKFSNPDSMYEIVGANAQKVRDAFGEPTRKETHDNFDVWVYRPWEDHREWELSVYFKDDVLIAIGTENL